jgi:hypothetical protein
LRCRFIACVTEPLFGFGGIDPCNELIVLACRDSGIAKRITQGALVRRVLATPPMKLPEWSRERLHVSGERKLGRRPRMLESPVKDRKAIDAPEEFAIDDDRWHPKDALGLGFGGAPLEALSRFRMVGS